MTNEYDRDKNHPVGTSVGALGGATAGAIAGSFFGPIGTLIGGAAGALAGGAAGHAVAENIDPAAENEYWRENYSSRPYIKNEYDYDADYGPAYTYGAAVRNELRNQPWDDAAEADIASGWEQARGSSRLSWDDAREASRDAYDRADRTYRAYDMTDQEFGTNYSKADYYNASYGYEDYQPAYRYGTQSRFNSPSAQRWEDAESDLERGWETAKGESRLAWDDAKHAARDAWHKVERALPGDADGDGR